MKKRFSGKSIIAKSASVLCVLSALYGMPNLNNQVVLPTTVINMSTAEAAVTSQQWEPSVKVGINDFLAAYGNKSANYQTGQSYAVFDFDNTTSIMDVEEQLQIWQLDHLAFAIQPNQMEQVLLTGIPADKLDATYGAQDGDGNQVTIRNAIKDAAAAYGRLYSKGFVKTQGSEPSTALQNNADYQEFRAKMRWLYDAIGETMDASVSYPWVTYWFTGMTPQQVYDLAIACDSYYGDPAKGQGWSKGSYESPANLNSQAGPVKISYKLGITVTPEIKELYKNLADNGIDCWVNSASPVDVVKAAVDYFQVPGVKGVVAMTNKLDKNGKYINAYDYDLHAQTQGVGKAETIDKIIAPQYQGHGPLFAAMDSQGDFNFCTEYKDTKAVLILNRKRSDDAALCAGIAHWQQQNNITLAKANAAGDTLFLLQGRNENTGTLWPDNQTLLLGKKDKAFLSDKALKAESELAQGRSIKDVLQVNSKLKDKYRGYKPR